MTNLFEILFLIAVLPSTKIPVPARVEKLDKKITEKITDRIDDGESKLSSMTSSSSGSSQPSRRLITVDFSLFKVNFRFYCTLWWNHFFVLAVVKHFLYQNTFFSWFICGVVKFYATFFWTFVRYFCLNGWTLGFISFVYFLQVFLYIFGIVLGCAL